MSIGTLFTLFVLPAVYVGDRPPITGPTPIRPHQGDRGFDLGNPALKAT